jgi:hypothetical protein
MNSYIFNFKNTLVYVKNLTSLFIAASLIIIIELTIFYKFEKRIILRDIYKEHLLEINFMKKDPVSKYLLGYKNYAFFFDKSEFLIFGDSSGLYGLKPLTIKLFINRSIVNSNAYGDSNWGGYISIAKHYIDLNPNIKYLILHITPHSSPSFLSQKFGDKLESQLFDLYSSKWRIFYRIPSIYFRKTVLEKFYYSILTDRKEMIEDYQNQENQISFISYNLGWIPLNIEKKNNDISNQECEEQIVDFFYDQNQKLNFIYNLQKIADFAQENNKKLLIVFSPVACKNSSALKQINEEIKKFKDKNPNIYFPFEFINTHDAKYFIDRSHLNPEGAEKHSIELGQKLAEFLKNQN